MKQPGFSVTDWSDPKTLQVHEWVDIEQLVDKYWCYTKDGTRFAANVFPIKWKAEVEHILKHRAALKKQLDDSMTLVHELLNCIARKEEPKM